MSEHTPGPWTVEAFDRLDKQIVIGPYHIAWVDADDLSHEEAAANARLIAAAPDLLAALQEVWNIGRTIERMREAIAKTQGPPQ